MSIYFLFLSFLHHNLKHPTNKSESFLFRYLVTELGAYSLDSYVRGDYKGSVIITDVRAILKQITAGVGHLHSLQIVHGDLKPTNILVSQKVGEMTPHIKVADFGLSHKAANQRGNGFLTAHTQGWMCPFDSDDDDPAFDIFSLGLLFVFTLLKV